jgi:hypothetical protein
MPYMKSFVWATPDKFPNSHYIEYKWKERKTNSYIFMQGSVLPHANKGQLNTSQDSKDYDLIYHSEIVPELFLKKYDCLPNTGKSPLVNKKVLDILQSLCPDDIQAFPAVIVPEDPKKHTFENHDYWVINITKTLSGIDYKQSQITFDDGEIFSFQKTILVEYEKGMPLLCREEAFHPRIYVAPPLVQALLDAKISGVRFLKDTEID